MSARTESRDARSASWATALNPASLRTFAAAWAFSGLLSPTTIVFPEPMRRVMAKPICPAPMSIITSAFTKSTSFPHSSDLFDLTLSFGVRSKSRSGRGFFAVGKPQPHGHEHDSHREEDERARKDGARARRGDEQAA